MTDSTISNLPAGAPAQPSDQIPIARGGANYSLTAQDVANLAIGELPGGVNTNVQYNDNNAFAGDNNFTTDGTGNVAAVSLTIGMASGQGAGSINCNSYYLNGSPIFSYGQFFSDATQSIAEAATTQSITFSNSSGTADVTLADNTKITFANPGVYLVAASVVTNDTAGGNAIVYWVNQNGTPVPDSATVCGQPIGGLLLTSACTYIVTTTVASEYIEMAMTGQAVTNEITATPAGTIGSCPVSPSIIVTVNRIG